MEITKQSSAGSSVGATSPRASSRSTSNGYRAYVAKHLEGHHWTFAQVPPNMPM